MCGKLTQRLVLVSVLGLVGAMHSHAAGAVAIWLFDDGAGDVAVDSTGNGYDGSLRNSPTWGDGVNGGGLWFTRAEGNKVIAPIPQLNTLTITMWALYTGLPSTNIGLLHVQTGEDDNTDPASKIIGMWVENTTLLWGRIIPAGAGNVNLPKNATVEADVWNHFAIVIDADSGKATQYLNGEAVGEVDYPGELTPYTYVNIGRQGGESWEGGIDEVAIFDRALSGDQIKAVMADIETGFPLAYGPVPANGAMLESTSGNLAWGAGDYAASHDVYFGESLEDVDQATPESDTFQGNQAAAEFLVQDLTPGATYYWRVDEVNDADPASPWKGDVWSFWVQPVVAWNPSPADGVPYVLPGQDLSWNAGMNALFHTVYFGESFDEVKDATTGGFMIAEATFDPGALKTNTTYYWRVDEFAGTGTIAGDVWSFTTVPDVAVADPTLVGWWTLDEGQGTTAVDWSGHGHHGTIVGAAQWDPDGMDRGALVLNGEDSYIVAEGMMDSGVVLAEYTMALWFRADRKGGARDLIAVYSDGPTFGTLVEFTAGGTMRFLHRSTTGGTGADLFTTETYDDGGWHHVAVVKTADELIGYMDGEVAVSEMTDDVYDGSFYVALGVLDHLRANGRFFPGPLDDARIYDRALTQDEIQQIMRGDPTLAGAPNPARDAVVDIRDATVLSWSAGDGAASHNVYLGADRDATAAAGPDSAEYQGNQPGTSLSLAGLVEFGGGDYYWRIDEVQADGSVVAGNIWKFTVPPYLLVDDFESYNNVVGSRVFETYIDGIGFTQPEPGNPGNGTGAAVGHDIWSPESPYFEGNLMETADVHGGNQAMPVYYDNTVTPGISEADRTFTPGQNWTAEGVTTLVVHFRGVADNTGDLYLEINGAKVPYDGDPADIADGDWIAWEIDLASTGVSLTNITTLTLGIEGGQAGVLFFDDIQLAKP